MKKYMIYEEYEDKHGLKRAHNLRELPPDARVLTREDVLEARKAAATRLNTGPYKVTVSDVIDELFGEKP